MKSNHTPRFRPRTIIVLMIAVALAISTIAYGQQPAAMSQQIYMMKTLKPGLKTVGVMGTKLSDKDLQEITRLGLGFGVEFVFARPVSPKDIALFYKQLLKTRNIEMLWLPDVGDEAMLRIGFQFLRENTVLDGIGLCTPLKDQVDAGALCSMQKEDGNIIVYINRKIAVALNVSIPNDPGSPILYITR